jgi:sulfatase modifying factor 1
VKAVGERARGHWGYVALAVLAVGSMGVGGRRRGCPGGMISIAGEFCIERYEGSLVEVLARGRTRPWSPFVSPRPGVRVRAVSVARAFPQGYISQVQARAACRAAGRRLCAEAEWVRACRGPSPSTWPYGPRYVPRRCNDDREGPVRRIFGPGDVFHEVQMNDPRLNQLPNTLARSGSHPRCRNRFGVFDMVGNLHEWVDATTRGGHGVFRGGYYVDVHINGFGCEYATRAHNPSYRDYSIGFRCCADLR